MKRQYQSIPEVLDEMHPDDRARFLQWVEPRMRAEPDPVITAALVAYRLAQQMK
jgi:hypothetical protein